MSIWGEYIYVTVYVQNISTRIRKEWLKVVSGSGAGQPGTQLGGDFLLFTLVPFH